MSQKIKFRDRKKNNHDASPTDSSLFDAVVYMPIFKAYFEAKVSERVALGAFEILFLELIQMPAAHEGSLKAFFEETLGFGDVSFVIDAVMESLFNAGLVKTKTEGAPNQLSLCDFSLTDAGRTAIQDGFSIQKPVDRRSMEVFIDPLSFKIVENPLVADWDDEKALYAVDSFWSMPEEVIINAFEKDRKPTETISEARLIRMEKKLAQMFFKAVFKNGAIYVLGSDRLAQSALFLEHLLGTPILDANDDMPLVPDYALPCARVYPNTKQKAVVSGTVTPSSHVVIYPGSKDFSVALIHGVFEISAPWESDVLDAAWYSKHEGYRVGTFRFQDQNTWRAAKLAFSFKPTNTVLIDQVKQKLKAMGHPAWIAFSDEKTWVEHRMTMPMDGIDDDFKQALSVFGRQAFQKILNEALKQLEKYPDNTRDFFAKIFPWLEASDKTMLSKWLIQHRGYTTNMTADEKMEWLGSHHMDDASACWVIDTNVWIKRPDILSSAPYGTRVLVPMVILNELDGLKKSPDIGLFARRAIESMRSSQKIQIEPMDLPDWDEASPDDMILASAKRANATILTYDTAMTLKAKALGLNTLDMDQLP